MVLEMPKVQQKILGMFTQYNDFTCPTSVPLNPLLCTPRLIGS